jgi:AraC-like DNA-binding protein
LPETLFKHDAVWVRQLAQWLQAQGLSVSPLLDAAGIAPQSLSGKTARIPIRQHAAFFELAAQACGDPCLGLNFGRTRDIRDAGLIGYVGLNSASILDALENLCRYRLVFSDAILIRMERREEQVTLHWRFRGLEGQPARQAMEFSAANLLRCLRQGSGQDIIPLQVVLAHPRNKGKGAFESFFGCPVGFGGEENVMSFRRAALEQRLPSADPRLLTILRQYCEEVLDRREEPAAGLVESVERLLVQRLASGRTSIDGVASELGMSRRSLSRRLGELGTSYSRLLDGLRRALAMKYLEDAEISLTEIAFLLGYAEVSSFNHAFRRWTGMAPGQFRAARR